MTQIVQHHGFLLLFKYAILFIKVYSTVYILRLFGMFDVKDVEIFITHMGCYLPSCTKVHVSFPVGDQTIKYPIKQ